MAASERGFESDFLRFAAATVEWTGTNSGIIDVAFFPPVSPGRMPTRPGSTPTISSSTPRSITVDHAAYRAYDVTGLSGPIR